MKIYIASTFESRKDLLWVRSAMQRAGHEVISSWLDEGDAPEGIPLDAWYADLAIKDLEEVQQCEIFALYTVFTNDRAGKEVEFGYALAHPTIQTYVVGPVRNIFHRLANRQFFGWAECLEHLRSVT